MPLALSSKELVFTFTVSYAIGPVQQGIGIYIYRLLCHWSCPARSWYLHLQFAMPLVLSSKELVFTFTVCSTIGPVQQGIGIYIYSLLYHWSCTARNWYLHLEFALPLVLSSKELVFTFRVCSTIGPVQQGIGIYIYSLLCYWSCPARNWYLHLQFALPLVLSSKELVFTFTVCSTIGPVQQGIGIYIYSLLYHWSCTARNWYLHLEFALPLVLSSKELVFTFRVCSAIGPVQQGIGININSLLYHWSCPARNWYLHLQFALPLVLSSKELVFTFTVCYAIGPVQQGIGIYIYSLLYHWSCPARNRYLHLEFAMPLVLSSKELVFTFRVCSAIGPVQQGIGIYI